jgi:acetyl-CoA carboxylase biotin carboxyl carrier protein
VDPKEIRELIELISHSNFALFELEGDGFKLKLVKQQAAAVTAAQPTTATANHSAETAARPSPALPVPSEGSAPASDAVPGEDGLAELNSPIVGTYYSAPSPGAPPFVEVGSKVKKGQVLCIVEAMKVMNEIESEIDAEVVEILVANEQPVEYGEVLLRLRPSS